MSPKLINTIQIRIVFKTITTAIFENWKKLRKSLSQMISKSNHDERKVMRKPKYQTSFRGNIEKDVKLFTAKLNNFL